MTHSNHFTARAVAASALIAALSGAAACSGEPAGPEPSPAGSTAVEPTHAGTAPSANPSASTKVDKQAATVRKALDKLAAKTPTPTTSQVLDALTAAGFDAGRVEATRSTTPLKNDVPSVMYGILTGKPSTCIVGEVRQGVATVTVTDPVEDGKRCLIGAVETPRP